MHRIRLFLVLLLASSAFSAANAQSGIQCVKEKCEGKGRACVETLYDTFETCTRAARKKCDPVAFAQKGECLKNGLHACALTRNQSEAACFADVKSCYKSCEPFEGKRVDYWCVARLAKGGTAAVCAGDPNAPRRLDVCDKAFSKTGFETMSCDSL
ncbi:MAG: hypothetical protein KF826_03300 [Xanthobacteraceae bacterium]|nr:hypothetical protein [Xanthobacteraceae bacterium]MCW5679314.1 hypothetical protein [Xanthobacteraceae bacterium]